MNNLLLKKKAHHIYNEFQIIIIEMVKNNKGSIHHYNFAIILALFMLISG
jgi:hypothetical protein